MKSEKPVRILKVLTRFLCCGRERALGIGKTAPSVRYYPQHQTDGYSDFAVKIRSMVLSLSSVSFMPPDTDAVSSL